MNNMMTGSGVPQTAQTPPAQQGGGGGYNQIMNQRMGMGLGGFGSFGGFGGGGGMPFNIGGFGGFNPMMGFGGFGGFNPMMGYGGMGGFGGFNPMMGFGGFGGFGGFNPMMGFGGFGGFNPMMGMGLGSFGGFENQYDPRTLARQQLQQTPMNPFGNQGVGVPNPASAPQMAQRYDASVANPQADYFRRQQQMMDDQRYNRTDYQDLMDRQRMANMPRPPSPPNMSGGLGLNPLPVNAPSDFEIASSLGFKDPNAGWWMTDDVKPKEEYERMGQQRNAQAKEYLNSIGYGQSGFDPSKYEVRRERRAPVSMSGLFGGFSR